MTVHQYWKKLIDKLFNKTIDTDELQQLNQWYDEKELNAPSLTEAALIERKQKAWKNIQTNTSIKKKIPSQKRRWITWSGGIKIAASLFVATIIGLQYWMPDEEVIPPAKTITISNKLGQVSSFTLPDSSKVWLSTGSSFSYPERFDSIRNVELIGEAYFEVKRNPAKPFVVQSAGLRTTVLGTSFNISAYPEESPSVSVLTGKVQVAENLPNGQKINLIKNQQTHWEKENGFTPALPFSPEAILKWQKGILVFENASLEEVIEEFSKWFNTDIKLQGAKDSDCRFTGEFKNTSLKNALEIIQYALKINYTLNENEVIITAHNCLRQ
ncbi:hypothetical protein DN752_03570 [Echinicola strongylocentroti]|uniref:FecR family protein n=1 Tax=Echinicola strongylocentroti TaxID=1795355 RepID=A0A2Z4IEF3_9BACT|nr:FecR domain-containing protein [Echinicola strongylocentroti]AWW29294.1 hypothetical protein DN752_03570 [Echinicola strongylocentroti]